MSERNIGSHPELILDAMRAMNALYNANRNGGNLDKTVLVSGMAILADLPQSDFDKLIEPLRNGQLCTNRKISKVQKDSL